MRNDRTNRLAMLLVVFCCLGTTAVAMPATTQTVLTVVVGGTTSQIAYELESYECKFQVKNEDVSSALRRTPILPGINMELQNLPPPSIR